MFRFHIHDLTLWERGFKHSWKHYIEAERHCRKCNYKEYQLLELFCPTFKRTGEYCFWCRPYAKIWQNHFDKLQIVCDNEPMKKAGRPARLERNMEMYEKRKKGYTLSMLMNEYGFKAKSSVSEILTRLAKQEKEGVITG